MTTDDDLVEPPLDDDALTTAEQVRARVAARTRLELQRCTETESSTRPTAPAPIPETHVEPSEEVERPPDDFELGVRVPPGGGFGVLVPGSESDSTTTNPDILAAAMSAAEIDTGTGPSDSAAKQQKPPPEVLPVHPQPPTTNPVQPVEPVPSTETFLGLIFQGTSEEAAWAFKQLPENIQRRLSGLGIESSWTEPPNPVASGATGNHTTTVQDEQTMADNKEPDSEGSAIISSIPTANRFNSLEDDASDVAAEPASTSQAGPAEQCGGLPRDSLSPSPPPPAPAPAEGARDKTLRLSPTAEKEDGDRQSRSPRLSPEPPEKGKEMPESLSHETAKTNPPSRLPGPIQPCQTTILFAPTRGRFTLRNQGDVAQAMQLRSGDNRAKTRVNPRRNVAAIDVTNTDAVHALLAVTDLAGLPVTAREATPRGKTVGIVRGLPPGRSTAEIRRHLRTETPIVAMQRLDGGAAARVHFDGERPNTVEYWGLDLSVEEEDIEPLQCFGCGRYGHVKAACPSPLLCPTCPGKHARGKCPLAATPDCPNCPFQHDAFSRGCAMYLRERSIIVAVRSTGCSWEQARATARNPARAPTKTSRNHLPPAPPLLRDNAWNMGPPAPDPVDFPALPNAQPLAEAQPEAAHPPRRNAETQTEWTELNPPPARDEQRQEQQTPPQQHQPPPRNPAAVQQSPAPEQQLRNTMPHTLPVPGAAQEFDAGATLQNPAAMKTSSVAEYRPTFGPLRSGRKRNASRRRARPFPPRGIPSEDIAHVEAQLQAAIDGLFAAVAQVAQMVSLHPTPDKFLFKGSPLTSLLQIAAPPANQHAGTPQ
ncbi:unnamed protein product [Ixodes persulcatus]